LAHNRDPRPVQVGRRRRSIGSQRALGRTTTSPAVVDTVVLGLVERVSGRLRGSGRVGRTVMLRMRFGDFSRATRSLTLARPTAQTEVLLAAVRALVAAATPMIAGQGLTLVGVAVANLDDDGPLQLVLPLDRRRDSALDAAVDRVRDRFGSAAVTRVVLLGQDHGPSVPLLPD
jgi:DNA polymerase-4